MRPEPVRMSIEEQDAIRPATQARDTALDRLANEDPTLTNGPDDTRSSVEVGRRTLFTPAARRDTTGLDLADEDVFGDLGDSFADGQLPEAPGSGASSTGTLNRLKTRPRSRQSSIIGRNDPPIRPSSRGGAGPGVSSSFNIGVFKRRAREPSILATSRRARSRTGSESATSRRTVSEAPDSGLEDDADVNPEAASTPSINRRLSRRSGKQRVHQAASSSSPPVTERGRRSTRQRTSEGSAELADAGPARVGRVEANGGMDIDSGSELSDLPDLPSPSPPTARVGRTVTPLHLDEINAPPASSDSEADEAVWPDIHTLAKKRRRLSVTTPLRPDGNLSEASSPPSLTHSPNLAATRRARTKQQARAPKMTTADLASLLPKRSYKRNRDQADTDSDDGGRGTDSSDGDDDAPSARRRRRQKGGGSRPSSRAGNARAALKAKQSTAPPPPRPAAAAAGVRRSARAASKTFRRGENKENESNLQDDDDDDDEENDNSQFQPLPENTFDSSTPEEANVQDADELKRATKKFKEVDQWELSFEEVAEPPSPPDAR